MADEGSQSDAPVVITRAERPISCLILHGLGGGPYELGPLIAALERARLVVAAPVLPGHEGPGPTMPSSKWSDWAATAEAAFDELAAAGGLVAVIGFSTGATLALYLASRRAVARQVLMAPFLAIRYTGLIPLHRAKDTAKATHRRLGQTGGMRHRGCLGGSSPGHASAIGREASQRQGYFLTPGPHLAQVRTPGQSFLSSSAHGPEPLRLRRIGAGFCAGQQIRRLGSEGSGRLPEPSIPLTAMSRLASGGASRR